MADEAAASANLGEATVRWSARRIVHASRVPRPIACGCGLPVAFDSVKQEFFCIGCGSSKLCTCGRSPFGSSSRPVNVV